MSKRDEEILVNAWAYARLLEAASDAQRTLALLKGRGIKGTTGALRKLDLALPGTGK